MRAFGVFLDGVLERVDFQHGRKRLRRSAKKAEILPEGPGWLNHRQAGAGICGWLSRLKIRIQAAKGAEAAVVEAAAATDAAPSPHRG
jgi:hypothetical protein